MLMTDSGRRKIWFAYFCAIVTWTLLTYADTVNALLKDRLLGYVYEGFVFINDFVNHYNLGALSWECLKEPISIYDPEVQRLSQAKLIPQVGVEKVFYSQYPPYVFVLMMPLALLGIKPAWFAWTLLGIAGISFGVYSLLKQFQSGRFTKAFAYFAIFASYPAWISFRLGQFTPILFSVFTWFWLSLQRKMWIVAGLLCGLSLIKPQYMPAMFLIGTLMGKAKFVGAFSFVSAIFLGLSVLVVGWDNVLGFPEALKFGEWSEKVAGVNPASQENIRGQVLQLLGSESSILTAVVMGIWILGSIALAYMWWRLWLQRKPSEATDSKRFKLLAATTIFVQLIVSPHTHIQDYLLAGISAIWILETVLLAELSDNSPSHGFLRRLLIYFPLWSWLFFFIKLFPVPIQFFFIWAILVVCSLVGCLKELDEEPKEVAEA